MGKAEALLMGVNKATSELIVTVDADTWWDTTALATLVNYLEGEKKGAVSGYIHPSDGEDQGGIYITLQQLEYSQGLGIIRSTQTLMNAIPVIPGPMGLYRAHILREILNERKMKTVTEDLEITLEMQKRGLPIGYIDEARSVTAAPPNFKSFVNQRLRWFIGWIHNLSSVHKDLLFKKRWISLVLWYSLLLGYGGSTIELGVLLSSPVFLWFAPDRYFFLLNAFIYLLFVLIVDIIYQAIALKFAYGRCNHKHLLLYTPLSYILRLINSYIRVRSVIKYLKGEKEGWFTQTKK
jgi:cellulose synthase/poly-beta-1,6-N-acetylglucosamine synthase-like glycosyltransferase